jgi:uncharacterized protein YutE (UPF0331/DUF86 family)
MEDGNDNRPSYPILDSLEKDVQYYKDAIKEVSDEVLDNQLSEYPVFIAHELPISIGEMILDKDDFSRSWSISASTLEELTENQVIQEDKQDDFKKVYKNPREHICIFLISEKGGNFIFYPYKDD